MSNGSSEKKDKSPESAPAAEATPVPAQGKLTLAGFSTDFLAAMAGGDAERAGALLARLMPAKTIGGVALPGLGSVDPTQKRQAEDFLGKPEFASGRDRLRTRLMVWIETLSGAEESGSAAEALDGKIAAAEALFDENQARAMEALRPLETTYRMLDGFFANAQFSAGDKVDAFIYNASTERLMDQDDRTAFESLARAIQAEYRDFSMRKTFGILVVPGWLGDVKKIDKLALLANQNKLTVVSDGPDATSAEGLREFMQSDAFGSLMGSEDHKRNLMLCSNYVLARDRSAFEREELYLPPSMHLAGVLYKNDIDPGIHQSPAGFKHGKLVNAVKTRFRVDRPQATELMVKHGMNCVVDFDGYCRMMGDQNLCNALGFTSIARIRTEDWLLKNIMNFFNYQAFEQITTQNVTNWKRSIHEFLRDLKGDTRTKPISDFEINVYSDERMRLKQEVAVELMIGFKGIARYFNIRMRDKDREREREMTEGKK